MKTLQTKNLERKALLTVGIFFFFFFNSFSAFTQESDEDKTLSPYFLVISDNPAVDQMPLQSTTAEVNIVGVIADVTIKQTYKNDGKNEGQKEKSERKQI